MALFVVSKSLIGSDCADATRRKSQAQPRKATTWESCHISSTMAMKVNGDHLGALVIGATQVRRP